MRGTRLRCMEEGLCQSWGFLPLSRGCGAGPALIFPHVTSYKKGCPSFADVAKLGTTDFDPRCYHATANSRPRSPMDISATSSSASRTLYGMTDIGCSGSQLSKTAKAGAAVFNKMTGKQKSKLGQPPILFYKMLHVGKSKLGQPPPCGIGSKSESASVQLIRCNPPSLQPAGQKWLRRP